MHNDDGGEVLSTTNLQCKSVLVLFGFLKAGAVSLDVIFWGKLPRLSNGEITREVALGCSSRCSAFMWSALVLKFLNNKCRTR